MTEKIIHGIFTPGYTTNVNKMIKSCLLDKKYAYYCGNDKWNK